jgi:hypothetical protein
LRYVQVGEGAVVGQEVEHEGRQGTITSLSGTHALVALKR